MLALSLLLSAAAGVNAILGGDVAGVMNTALLGVPSLASRDTFAPRKKSLPEWTTRASLDPQFPFDCIGLKDKYHFKYRERSGGEEPAKCKIEKATAPGQADQCLEFKSTGPDAKTVPWSDIEKQLKAGAAPGKEQQECARDGIEVFQKCRAEACEFAECDEKATAAIKSCQGLQ
ncbi:hypothetical protein BM221_007320 [Beauveria bassiana]|uniref:Clock-controlled pheromone ccg-4 n=1 Tax=Beauveria bassiana TaxID=176275 RepID=A0A2N6NGB8_BEABA|nr:hypothetical protein BM221_007320 [Beauveria bassiana]